jgi:hypothetical protein
MIIMENGMGEMGSFKVLESRYNRAGAFWEYQIIDTAGDHYWKGTWIREKNLRVLSSPVERPQAS